MYDFVFHNPTKIIFGPDREREIGRELKDAAVGRVLLVYGRSSVKQSGLLARVSDALKAEGIEFFEHGGVVSNPVLSHVREGIALVRQNRVEAVLAVGGGSVLDEAKAIAVGVVAEVDVWEFFTGREVTAALPVFTVLTLAASGSEMNGNAVITNEETRQKYNIGTSHVYPRVSILNPELTHTVSPEYSAYGAVDAIAHLIEAYFTKQPGTNLQDRLVEGLILTIMENAETIRDQPDHAQARASMMWAATLALNGLTPAGVGPYTFPNHMIEHSLSALYDIPHGAGLAVVIPAWMQWYRPQNPGQFQRFASQIFGLHDGEEGIVALKKWFSSLNCPTTLQEAGIAAADIPLIRDNAYDTAKLWEVDKLYPPESIEEILQLATR
ncbi:iron-containing alcohol dehydrogenase [Desulfurivibrio alkaliphilus]|uniref:Iron-containing alcohol dehydrogenase n=1 Tax=Desulfurivibrio alkaliphilus (strain DSM 19089 / UNIQEM U267 / AHT2) TaxID=589865 RepID=D6Z5Q3_DESAT|nr:iron-containing alcohol dehydrogenase [Desulfurivibrio alkaliphilus]ADH86790.1 iron-containing alcohol dehydrogenase [Desulfurivibrio alkaliphilus AHT 2]